MCKQCLYTPQNCISCKAGDSLLGGTCTSSSFVGVKLVLKPLMNTWSEQSTSAEKNRELMKHWGYIQNMLMQIGSVSDMSSIMITSVSNGSVIV